MKLNWAERWVVNNPVRVFQQQIEVKWLKRMMPLAPGATALEMGCGRGAGAKLILRVFQPGRLHIQDLDSEMILKANDYLSQTAIANGISTFTAWVLAENHAMLDPLMRAGASMRPEDGVIRVQIPLPDPEEDFDGSLLGTVFRAAAAESPPAEPFR